MSTGRAIPKTEPGREDAREAVEGDVPSISYLKLASWGARWGSNPRPSD